MDQYDEQYAGYTEDQLAKELLKRFVQATGRAFYDDAKVAVLDVLCEDPYYLRDPDGSRNQSAEDETKARAARLKASDAGGSKNLDDAAKGAEDEQEEEEEESEDEEDIDPGLRPMDRRLVLPLNGRSGLRAVLHNLRDSERLIRCETLGGQHYFYIDYEWFFKVVSWRVKRLGEELHEQESELRNGTKYVCDLCRHEVPVMSFTTPYCVNCVESGENKASEVPLREVNNKEAMATIATLRDKVQRQLSNRAGMASDGSDKQSAAAPRRLLALMKRLEDRSEPIHPIPLTDIKRMLEEFQSRGIPRGGFSTNRPSSRLGPGGQGSGTAPHELAAGLHLMKGLSRASEGGGSVGVFSAAHFAAAKEQRERANAIAASQKTAADAAAAASAFTNSEGTSSSSSSSSSTAQALKRPRIEHGDKPPWGAVSSPQTLQPLPSSSGPVAALKHPEGAAVVDEEEEERLAAAAFAEGYRQKKMKEAAETAAAQVALRDAAAAEGTFVQSKVDGDGDEEGEDDEFEDG